MNFIGIVVVQITLYLKTLYLTKVNIRSFFPQKSIYFIIFFNKMKKRKEKKAQEEINNIWANELEM